VVGVLASAIGLIAAVGDTEGDNLVSWLMFIGPGLAGAFPTLELAWWRDHGLSMATVKPRWFIFPAFGGFGAVVVMSVTEIVLRPRQAIEEAMMDASELNFRHNRAALVLMPIMVINAFVIGIAIVTEIVWLAVLSILAEVVLVVITRRHQLVGRKGREESGLPAGAEPGDTGSDTEVRP